VTEDSSAEGQSEGRHSLKEYVKALGPGLISGASDNDPTTVATMSVLDATTVYGLSWLTILIFPMLAVVQMMRTPF
jgi:Mn2+/Fe2+ NRAMP family transporter